MNWFKKEIDMNKFLKYCHIGLHSKSKRIKKKANKITSHQIEEFFPHY